MQIFEDGWLRTPTYWSSLKKYQSSLNSECTISSTIWACWLLDIIYCQGMKKRINSLHCPLFQFWHPLPAALWRLQHSRSMQQLLVPLHQPVKVCAKIEQELTHFSKVRYNLDSLAESLLHSICINSPKHGTINTTVDWNIGHCQTR